MLQLAYTLHIIDPQLKYRTVMRTVYAVRRFAVTLHYLAYEHSPHHQLSKCQNMPRT